jgi:hypothetical protein
MSDENEYEEQIELKFNTEEVSAEETVTIGEDGSIARNFIIRDPKHIQHVHDLQMRWMPVVKKDPTVEGYTTAQALEEAIRSAKGEQVEDVERMPIMLILSKPALVVEGEDPDELETVITAYTIGPQHTADLVSQALNFFISDDRMPHVLAVIDKMARETFAEQNRD